MLDAIIGAYQNRFDEVAETISAEMGAPIWLSKAAQAAMGIAHLTTARGILEKYEFQKEENGTLIAKEPVRRVRAYHAVELAGQPDCL